MVSRYINQAGLWQTLERPVQRYCRLPVLIFPVKVRDFDSQNVQRPLLRAFMGADVELAGLPEAVEWIIVVDKANNPIPIKFGKEICRPERW